MRNFESVCGSSQESFAGYRQILDLKGSRLENRNSPSLVRLVNPSMEGARPQLWSLTLSARPLSTGGGCGQLRSGASCHSGLRSKHYRAYVSGGSTQRWYDLRQNLSPLNGNRVTLFRVVWPFVCMRGDLGRPIVYNT